MSSSLGAASQEPSPTSLDVDARPAEIDSDQLASANKRIEELEERQMQQQLEIRRLEDALRKASLVPAAHFASAGRIRVPSNSTKSVEEMTSATSGAPSSQLSPRTASSANEAELALSLASGMEGDASPCLRKAMAAAASHVGALPPLQSEQEVTEEVQQEAFECRSLPASFPSTPEMPVRELPAMEMASFLSHWQSFHSGAACAETTDFSACTPGSPSYGLPEYGTPTAAASQVNADGDQGQFPEHVWYRVAFCGGICVRAAPDVDAPRTGLTMPCNEVFAVSEAIQSADHRMYLRLADGRGWVFDDSALFPEDPAVVQGHWAPAQQEHVFPTVVSQEVLPPPQVPPSHHSSLQPGDTQCVKSTLAVSSGSSPHSCQQAYSLGSVAAASAGPPLGVPVPPPPQAPAPHAVSHAAMLAPPVQVPSQVPVAWYRVAFCGGISVRIAPDVDAPRTGLTLPCHQVFAVAETVLGNDQRLYLRLMDGRGWVFDDIMLVPEDPAVLRVDAQALQVHRVPAQGTAHSPQAVAPGGWQPGAIPLTGVPLSRGAPSVSGASPGRPVLSTALPGNAQQPWVASVSPAGGLREMPAANAFAGTTRRWTRGKRGGLKKHRRRHQHVD